MSTLETDQQDLDYKALDEQLRDCQQKIRSVILAGKSFLCCGCYLFGDPNEIRGFSRAFTRCYAILSLVPGQTGLFTRRGLARKVVWPKLCQCPGGWRETD